MSPVAASLVLTTCAEMLGGSRDPDYAARSGMNWMEPLTDVLDCRSINHLYEREHVVGGGTAYSGQEGGFCSPTPSWSPGCCAAMR